jgi:hypothetical protein
MALTSPLAITVGTAATLPRISDASDTSVYLSNDRSLRETIWSRTLSSGRDRQSVRLEKTKLAADPYTAINKSVSASVSVVMDFPAGVSFFSEAEKLEMTTGLFAQLQASTSAMLKQIWGLEH